MKPSPAIAWLILMLCILVFVLTFGATPRVQHVSIIFLAVVFSIAGVMTFFHRP